MCVGQNSLYQLGWECISTGDGNTLPVRVDEATGGPMCLAYQTYGKGACRWNTCAAGEKMLSPPFDMIQPVKHPVGCASLFAGASTQGWPYDACVQGAPTATIGHRNAFTVGCERKCAQMIMPTQRRPQLSPCGTGKHIWQSTHVPSHSHPFTTPTHPPLPSIHPHSQLAHCSCVCCRRDVSVCSCCTTRGTHVCPAPSPVVRS